MVIRPFPGSCRCAIVSEPEPVRSSSVGSHAKARRGRREGGGGKLVGAGVVLEWEGGGLGLHHTWFASMMWNDPTVPFGEMLTLPDSLRVCGESRSGRGSKGRVSSFVAVYSVTRQLHRARLRRDREDVQRCSPDKEDLCIKCDQMRMVSSEETRMLTNA